MENTTKGKYTDLVLGEIMDSVTMWLKASRDDCSVKRKAMATSAVVARLAGTYKRYHDKFLIKKPGSFRKHVYGARSHFTFRTVISASTGKHKHNEVVPPWIILCTTFRPHVINKLVKRGYSYKAADKAINAAIGCYDPVIDEIGKELIAECPYEQGIPVIVNRNPTLLQGSALFMYIPKFGTDPKILVTTFSPLAAKNCNADFDGDVNIVRVYL